MKIHIKYLFSILLFITLIGIGNSYTLSGFKQFLYVNPTCTTSGGITCTQVDTFKTIQGALDQLKHPATTIVLKDGTYRGEGNVDLVVKTSPYVRMRSEKGLATTIIDCENMSYFMKVFNTKEFSLTGVTIQNCVGSRGGAIYTKDSSSLLTNIKFTGHFATKGAALYAESSKVELMNPVIQNNVVLNSGAAIYSYLSTVVIKGASTSLTGNNNNNTPVQRKDILCKNSTFTIGNEVTAATMDTVAFECLDSCDSTYSNKVLCQNAFYKSSQTSRCGDGVCDPNESCLNCPDECSCHITGLVLETFDSTCKIDSFTIPQPTQKCTSVKNSTLTTPALENFMGGINNIVVRLFGYITVDSPQEVPFTFQGSYFGVLFKINAHKQLFFNQATRFNETTTVYLTNRHSHFVEIILFSNNPDGSQRQFNLVPFNNNNIKMFFSNLICGDDISNTREKKEIMNGVENKFYCPADLKFPTFNNNIECGDGICNENEPNSCYQDCYKEMTKTCPTRQVPDGHISPGFYFSGDTLGDIISNQFIWRLPGSEHLSFGVDIVSGEEGASPLFQFDYCSNVASNVIEDPYRGNVYHIPPEFHGKAYPHCTYSTSTESFTSTDQMKTSMEKSCSVDFSASVSGGTFVKAGANVAFSRDKSSKESKKMSSTTSQTIFKTDLVCKSSYVEMDLNKVSLHPNFLNELANVKDLAGMHQIVRKHGTHFYKKTFLGGKLTQISITESSKVDSTNSDEWKESVSGSFSASVSSPTFSVSGSVAASNDRSQSQTEQQYKQGNSTTSRLLIYGGTPAAFSPAQDSRSSPGFKEWAQSIDVLPIPVDYQLYPIRVFINPSWINAYGVNLRTLWEESEEIYPKLVLR